MVKRAMLPQVRLRRHRPGDLGWVVQRHGELYWREYGFDQRFEAMVAAIAARFLDDFEPGLERSWIAESGGRRLGAVFLVAQSARVAQLRMLFLDPQARGLGLGRRLVAACIRFAREAGYRKVALWTYSELAVARAIYEKAGFRRIRRERQRRFGRSLVGEYWELVL